jgi:hypothetical protein
MRKERNQSRPSQPEPGSASPPVDGDEPPPIQWHTIPRDATIPCPHCGQAVLRIAKTWDDEDDYPDRSRVTVCQRRYCPSCDTADPRAQPVKRWIYTRYFRPRRVVVGIMPPRRV